MKQTHPNGNCLVETRNASRLPQNRTQNRGQVLRFDAKGKT
jgi:hypothetical protein